jgi:hypothetical protein
LKGNHLRLAQIFVQNAHRNSNFRVALRTAGNLKRLFLRGLNARVVQAKAPFWTSDLPPSP